ncbi:MAG: hypothetical protein ACFE9N_10195 [Promethearchaeota archaeon]
MISPLIGEEGQEKLSRIKVLQIGAGGLGFGIINWIEVI